MASISVRTRLITSTELALGSGQIPIKTAVCPEIVHLGVVVLGPQHYVGDFLQPDDGVVLLLHRQALELIDRAQVGVGGQIDLDVRTLALAEGGQEIVGGQCLAHLGRADVERRHAIGLEPDAHCKGAGAQDVRPLHAPDGRQAGLDNAHQVFGDLVLLQQV